MSLLGIVFFFALAVQRGWIGPVARVSLGAAASALMLGAGWWLRRRFGDTFAATAAAGVGIAGAYATLLAAAARYDLVSDPVALVLAAGIAAVATVTALAWSDELLAGLGLVGAILAPVAVAVRDDRLAHDRRRLRAADARGDDRGLAPPQLAARCWSSRPCARASRSRRCLDDAAGREGAALALAIVCGRSCSAPESSSRCAASGSRG